MTRETHLDRVAHERAGLRLLEPHERRQRLLVDVGSTGQERARDDVQVAVAVEIHRLRAVDARHLHQRVLDERIAVFVLQPLDPVIRLHDPIVERIAVREEDVDVAVAVEVDHLDPRRPPVGMGRGVDHLLLEREVPFVDVREYRLVLLREHRHEIHLAVVIQVDGNDVNAAGARIDRVRDEVGLRRIRRAVLQDGDLTRRAPAERGDRQVGLPVAVEVRGFDVGDARPPVEPERREFAVAQPAQPDHRALLVIAGKEGPEVGDEQIGDAVLVQIRERDVGGVRDAGEDRQAAARFVRVAHEDHALAHVGAKDVEPPVAVDIDQVDVRDGGRVRHVRHRQRLPHELDGRLGGIRPGLRRGEPLGRARHVVRERLLHVGRKPDRAEGIVGDRRQPILADEHHPNDFVAPRGPWKDVGWWKRVAHAAGHARLLLVRLRCTRRRRLLPRCVD